MTAPEPRPRSRTVIDALADGHPMARYCWWWWALGAYRPPDGHPPPPPTVRER